MLMDQLIEARVHSALGQLSNASLRTIGIDVQVKDGRVTLSGAISDDKLIADIVRRVHAVDGVTEVKSQIHYLAFARMSE